MHLVPVFVLFIINTCFGAPTDEPIHIDLPIYNQPQTDSDILYAKPIQPENYPGGDLIKQNQKTHIGTSLDAKVQSVHKTGIFGAPTTVKENALQETEGYGSKVLSIKEGIQGAYAGIFQIPAGSNGGILDHNGSISKPEPIVDTISESEKYGNTGDKFYTVGRALVGGAEGISNFVNMVLEIPGTVFKSITRSASEKLNNLGGKLIGLY